MATHSSVLAWRIPWTEEPGGLVEGVTKSRTGLRKKKKEIKKYLETNVDGDKTYQNQWDDAKVIHKKKFIVINAYIK